MIPASSDALKYYRPKIKIKDLNLLNDRLLILNKVWIIPYTSDIYGLNYKRTLEKKGFFIKNKKVFRNLELEEWNRNFFPNKIN